jgi:thiamine biosynthesis lipoprotein
VNDAAGADPVTVDRKIIDLLLDCKAYYAATGGRVNVAMGGVLKLWHDARSDGIDDPRNARLPDEAALREAAGHASFDAVVIDENAKTVYITEKSVQLDVGAIAKGWAAQRVAENAPEGLLISVGGNVCATGAKDENGTPWVIGIQNPDGGEDYLHTVYLSAGSVVTSGDYQRTYQVDGKLYHHIIDPDTLYPSEYWRSVTIVCPDSGLADALSTALFLLPLEEGRELAERYGADAMWVDAEGDIHYTPGFEEITRT